jgi:hypothetical protein
MRSFRAQNYLTFDNKNVNLITDYMFITIIDDGGSAGIRPHIEDASKAIPFHWKALLPRRARIENLPKHRLPHTPDIWGNHQTIKRTWSVRIAPPASSSEIRICAYAELAPEAGMLELFKRDIASAVLLSAFDNRAVSAVIRDVMKESSGTRYQIGRSLAETISSFIISHEKASAIHPRAILFVRNLNEALERSISECV